MAWSILSHYGRLLGLNEATEQAAPEIDYHNQRHNARSNERLDTAEACSCSVDSNPDTPAACCSTAADSSRCTSRAVATGQHSIQGKVLYGSESGSTRRLAEQLALRADKAGVSLVPTDLARYETESLCKEKLVIFVISTQQGGVPPGGARWFMQWLAESCTDFRVGQELLQLTQFAVFGCGNSVYADCFNKVAQEVHSSLESLGGRALLPCRLGDEDEGALSLQVEEWGTELLQLICAPTGTTTSTQLQMSNLHKAPIQQEGQQSDGYATSDADDESDSSEEAAEDDMEDIGGPTANSATRAKAKKTSAANSQPDPAQPKQMLTPALRATLSKQGYKLIGSHSGVKVCRWTKSMLRGRGGCYKVRL